MLVQHKVEEIDAKIQDLRAMRAALAGLLRGCTDGAAPINHCPLIEALADGGKSRRSHQATTGEGEEEHDGDRPRSKK